MFLSCIVHGKKKHRKRERERNRETENNINVSQSMCWVCHKADWTVGQLARPSEKYGISRSEFNKGGN